MWDKVFTASLAAYSISLVVFLLGHYVLQIHPITVAGIGLMGVAGISTGASGIAPVLNVKARG